jgi:hypothetical protein
MQNHSLSSEGSFESEAELNNSSDFDSDKSSFISPFCFQAGQSSFCSSIDWQRKTLAIRIAAYLEQKLDSPSNSHLESRFDCLQGEFPAWNLKSFLQL